MKCLLHKNDNGIDIGFMHLPANNQRTITLVEKSFVGAGGHWSEPYQWKTVLTHQTVTLNAVAVMVTP